MNARFTIAALFATILSASTSWGQNWSVDPNTGRPYAGTITTTTITTYAPANQETVNYTPQAVYSVPDYNSPADVAPTYQPSYQSDYQPNYQPNYQPSVAPAYVPQQAPAQEYVPQPVQTPQPIIAMSVATPSVQTVNYVQPVSYYRPYEHHEHARPVYYGAAYRPFYVRPAYYAPAPIVRPVYAPVFTPAVSYAPAYAPAPVAAYAAPAPAYAAPAYPGGPQVWVHPKVYVQGEPIRNLIRAITP